jgi:hypothetical protein
MTEESTFETEKPRKQDNSARSSRPMSRRIYRAVEEPSIPSVIVLEQVIESRGRKAPPTAATSKASKMREEQVDKLLKNRPTHDLKALMTEYLKRLGLPGDSKIFTFSGQDEHIRQALKDRGWVENRTAGSSAFHLKWVYSDTEADYKALLPGQRFNHFPNNRELTTKSGLCQHLNSVSSVNISVDQFFPRCYDLGDSKQVKEFIKDYERTAVIGIVKHACMSREGVEQVVRLALRYAEFFVRQAEDMCELRTQYSFVPDFKAQFSFSREDVQRLIAYRTSSLELPDDLVNDCADICRRVCRAFPQSEVDGTTNVWILKPSQNARGSGIRCIRDLQEVLASGNQLQARVIQKYIERPFLLHIEAKPYKFDIRQWVLVTSWEPLEVYAFDSCYLRICQEEFDLADIENLYRHLTNYSLQKTIAKAQEATVWSSLQFSEYLASVSSKSWGEVCCSVHRVILDTIEGLSEAVDHKEGCFELYGFDILLDEELRPWLLEVNLSPACAARTPWLAEMLSLMAEGALRLVLKEADQEPLYDQQRELVGEPTYHTNAWQMLYKSTESVSSETTVALEIVGKPINIRAERKIDRNFLSEQAARLLQRYGRGFLVRRRAKHQLEREAATLIQAQIRKRLAQLELVRRRRHRAALKIQTSVRAWRARQLLLHLKQVSITTKLQSLYRGQTARRLYKQLRLARSALVIQKTFRRLDGYRAKQECEVYHSKVRLIQLHWLMRWRLKVRAATLIQCHCRKLLAGRLLVRKRRERQAAVTIQCWARGLHAKATLVHLRRVQAATKLQSFSRMLRAKRQLRFLIETQAALVIQSHYRSYRSKVIREALSKLKGWRVNAASHIQRVMRGYIDRLKVTQRMELRAAVAIQTAYRRFCAQRRNQTVLIWNQAATKIQAYFKGRLAYRKYKMLRSIMKLKADRLKRKAQRGESTSQTMAERLAYRPPSSLQRYPIVRSGKPGMRRP